MIRQKRKISTPPQAAYLPVSLGGYRVLGPLAPRKTFRAQAPGGGEVVLKILPSHCMLRGELHVSNHERLSRVRQLAEKGIANLHGVWRDRGFVYLVWDFLPGHPISSNRIIQHVTPRELLLLARELVLTVDSLHGSGIVHGAIHGNNVIIDSTRRLRLTHISPLLYHDPSGDVEAIAQLLHVLLAARGETDSPLGEILTTQVTSLRQLAAQIAVLANPIEPDAQPSPPRVHRPNPRRRAFAGAAVAAATGLGISVGVWRYASRSDDSIAPLPQHIVLDKSPVNAESK